MKNPLFQQRFELTLLAGRYAFCSIDANFAAIVIIEAMAFFNWLRGLGN